MVSGIGHRVGSIEGLVPHDLQQCCWDVKQWRLRSLCCVASGLISLLHGVNFRNRFLCWGVYCAFYVGIGQALNPRQPSYATCVSFPASLSNPSCLQAAGARLLGCSKTPLHLLTNNITNLWSVFCAILELQVMLLYDPYACCHPISLPSASGHSRANQGSSMSFCPCPCQSTANRFSASSIPSCFHSIAFSCPALHAHRWVLSLLGHAS